MAKLGIVAIHGIGKQSKGFYSDLRSGLNKNLKQRGITEYEFKGFLYAPIIQINQEALWDRIDKNTLSLDVLRRFLLFYFGDAGAYGYKPGTESSVYKAIHKKLEGVLKKELAKLSEDGTLVILAQSFGCHVVSNLLWDLEKWQNDQLLVSVQKRLKLMITTGCNIPLFVCGLEKVQAFKKPNEDFRWYNYYDKDDVLGWPLRPLSASYRKLVTKDIIINTGLPILSHLNYWRSGRALGEIADAIKDVI
jgi:hypothetical protein